MNKDLTKSIVLRKSKDTTSISVLSIPGKMFLSNTSNFNLQFGNLKYLYAKKNKTRGIRFKVFREEIRFRTSKIELLKHNQSEKLEFYSRHIILFYPKTDLKLYLKEMHSKNQDTLHIGSVEEFKNKHPGFLEKLTKHDSIQISIRKNKDAPWEYIKIPVTY